MDIFGENVSNLYKSFYYVFAFLQFLYIFGLRSAFHTFVVHATATSSRNTREKSQTAFRQDMPRTSWVFESTNPIKPLFVQTRLFGGHTMRWRCRKNIVCCFRHE